MRDILKTSLRMRLITLVASLWLNPRDLPAAAGHALTLYWRGRPLPLRFQHFDTFNP